MNEKRVGYLDFLRGIAIILIVIGHMERGLVSAGISSSYSSLLDNVLYSIHLPLIFILSGITEYYFGKINKISFIDYVKKNIISLYIPYLIFIYLFWFIKMFIFTGNHEAEFSMVYTLFCSGRWVFWFLLSLLFIKLIHGFLEIHKINLIYNSILWIVLYVINIILLFNSKEIVILTWLQYGLFYNLGYLFGKYKLLDKLKKINYKLIILNILIVIISCIFFNYITTEIRMIIMGIPVSLILLNIFSRNKTNSIINICGKNSMVIYLLHTLFTSAIRTVLVKLGIVDFTINLIVGTFGSILISLSIVWLYQNIKQFHFIEYLFYPNSFFKKVLP